MNNISSNSESSPNKHTPATMLRNDPGYHIGKLSALRKFGILFSTLRNPQSFIMDRMALRNVVEYTTRTGVRFKVRSKTSDINEAVVVMSGKEYPPELLDIDTTDRPVVFDIGGHIGSFSLYVKNRKPDAQVIVFEPFVENLALLKSNLQLNGFTDVTVISKALYGSAGRYFLDLHHHGFDGGTLSDTPTQRCFEIETITLEDVLESNPQLALVDVMKMDIEGSEFEIVRKSLKTLTSSVRRLVMEYHPNSVLSEHNRDYLIHKLTHEAPFVLIYETANILGLHNASIS